MFTTFDLPRMESIYADSKVMVVFVLSTGADPTSQIYKFCDQVNGQRV